MLEESRDVKGELHQQMEYNQMIKIMEKKNDIEIGRKMTEAAQASIKGEEEFRIVKRNRASKILKKQWDEQLKLKTNE
jgi:hypothetical protein